MTPYYDRDGITIYCGDSRAVRADLGPVDAVITDPPYGINWQPRTRRHEWHDNESFDPRVWLTLGREHVFWGANYFADALPISPDWLAWIKRPMSYDFSGDRRTYSTIELAWSDFGCRARHFVHVWDGGKRAGAHENRSFIHPAQKPLEVMLWCLSFSRTTGTIVDPFCGSGTTLVAAARLGRRAIGVDRDERYCAIAVERLAQAALFAPPSVEPRQSNLDAP